MKHKILFLLFFFAGCATPATLPQATVARFTIPEINMIQGGAAPKLPHTYDKFQDPSLVIFQNHSDGIATIVIDGKNNEKIVLQPKKVSPDIYLEPGKHKIAINITTLQKHFAVDLKQNREINIGLKGHSQIITIY